MGKNPLVILQHDPDDPPGSVAVALRELRVPFEVRRLDLGDPLPVWPHEASGVIALGGNMHVQQTRDFPFLAQEIKLLRHIVHEGAPAWGICLGAQLLAVAAGGDVYRRKHPEMGWISIEKVVEDPLLHDVPSPFVAFNWHEYWCSVPSTSHLVARHDDGVQVFRTGGRSWGTQFHPEVDEVMAPHWVRDAALKHPHLDGAAIARLQADTAEHLPGYPAFCRRLTRNFVLTSGLLPAD